MEPNVRCLRGADSLKLVGLVMVGLKTLITNETNWDLRCRFSFPLEGKLLAAVMTRNAEIPATFDPFNEHGGLNQILILTLLEGDPANVG